MPISLFDKHQYELSENLRELANITPNGFADTLRELADFIESVSMLHLTEEGSITAKMCSVYWAIEIIKPKLVGMGQTKLAHEIQSTAKMIMEI
jgi:hypothetical protein